MQPNIDMSIMLNNLQDQLNYPVTTLAFKML